MGLIRHCVLFLGLWFPLVARQQPQVLSRCAMILISTIAVATADRGPISSWSQWSACSSTCGSGVTSRVRMCRDPQNYRSCQSGETQFKVCNPKKCEQGTPNTKLEHCRSVKEVQYHGSNGDWHPVYDPVNPCSLTCSTSHNGTQIIVTFADSVPDGTWCQENGSAVCVESECLFPGCDGILGSRKSWDSCGVCGGDESTCSRHVVTTKKIFTWRMTWSPCSVSCGVGQRHASVHCLNVIKNRHVRERHCARKRKPHSLVTACMLPPCISEMQDDDPTTLSNSGDASLFRAHFADLFSGQLQDNSKFVVGNWSPCSVTCGTGYKSREVKCQVYNAVSQNVEQLPDHECFDAKPSSTENCDQGPCRGDLPLSQVNTIFVSTVQTYRWQTGNFTDCSRSCRKGKQESKLACVQIESGQEVSPTHCTGLKKPAIIIRDCNSVPCPPRWEVGSWGLCTKDCGGGVMLRSVHCVQEEVGGALTTVDDYRCPDPIPEEEKVCNVVYCPSLWATDNWSRCSQTCGDGIQTRRAYCVKEPVSGRKVTVSDAECLGPRPVTSRHCSEIDCPDNSLAPPVIQAENYTFIQLRRAKKVKLNVGGKLKLLPGQSLTIRCPVKNYHRRLIFWSKNFKLISMVGRVRTTFNGNLKITKANPLDDAGTYTCMAGPQSADVIIEFLSPSDAQKHIRGIHKYFTDDSSTIVRVQPGEPTYQDGVVQDVGHNGTKLILYVSDEWSPCSVTCGSGHQKRRVTCTRVSNKYLKLLPSRECVRLGLEKPEEIRKCSPIPDCPVWSVGNWSKCSLKNCIRDGYAERRRPIQCSFLNGSLASHHLCARLQEPESARECVNNDCISHWTTSPWTSCHPSCGDQGTKMRILMCSWEKTNLPGRTACRDKPRPTATKTCKLRPCPESPAECRDNSNYCSLALLLRLCNYAAFRDKCCRSCSQFLQSTLS